MLIRFNKPYQTHCQFSGEAETLANYIRIPKLYPAGRLDKDSEGLVLLTDDGKLQAKISDPKHKLPKCYWVQVEGIPDKDALRKLRRGVVFANKKTLPAEARLIPEPELWDRQPPIRERKHIPTQWLELIIKEGRNRQVRHMTAAVGHPTLRLVRASIGPWSLENLQPGQWQETSALI
jgi:23S rRNA pseudouridine2457 synthase